MKRIARIAAAATLSFSLACAGAFSGGSPSANQNVHTLAVAPLAEAHANNLAASTRTFPWSLVIKILTSKAACEAERAFYHNMFPDKPKLHCKKSGKVWLLTR